MRSVLKSKFAPLALALVMIGSAVAAGATMASAATTYTRSYTIVKEFYSQPLKRCVRVTLWGSVTFQTKVRNEWAGRITDYVNRKIENPTVRASILDKCGAGAKPATATKASVNQRWYDHNCAVEPSISAGFPWAISVGATAKCGSVKTASRTSSYGKGKTYTQYNSGRPVSWKDGKAGSVPQSVTDSRGKVSTFAFCLGATATVKIYVGTKDDSWVAKDLKACVKK
ncbi:hypothetical protein OG792_31495 [Micromonospora sp. NBC_01699]|uniref:hypothetical protein n=1 Tax=Micromonospora sp. NBC_01699 TaxID=2975984 RepID=UPI002E284D8A|nr:hypothetical protein [Micromonospora sp. NBC_01699]